MTLLVSKNLVSMSKRLNGHQKIKLIISFIIKRSLFVDQKFNIKNNAIFDEIQ